jgi:1,4-dihydroxy-2-naphthoate octaprenyltransferase
MPTLKTWQQAARLRTLPLAASGILCGGALAWYDGAFSWTVSGLALLTALLLQILSNFANDYGDSKKGTDNEQRVGPERTVQSGALSLAQMKNGMVLMGVAALISGISLVYLATTSLPEGSWVFFLALGLLSIGAAIMYTVGKRAYGYQGMGDIMVFLFFGVVSVCGVYYLNAGQLPLNSWLLATSIGLLSTGVLNLNNMRDIDNDIRSGKMTVAARMGFNGAKLYHGLLILGGLASFSGLVLRLDLHWIALFILLIPALLIYKDLRTIIKIGDKSQLDPFLKKLAIGTFLLSLVFVIGVIISRNLLP